MITNPSCQSDPKDADPKFHQAHFEDELGDIGGPGVGPPGLTDISGYGHYGGGHGGHYNGHYYNSWAGHGQQSADYNNYYSGGGPGGHLVQTTQAAGAGQYYGGGGGGGGPPPHHYSHAPAPGLQYHQVTMKCHMKMSCRDEYNPDSCEQHLIFNSTK